MNLNRNRLYTILLIACTVGYVWLLINTKIPGFGFEGNQSFCLVKHITDVPCPSCGSTRSILSLFKGDFSAAFYWNPIGILVISIMTIVPLWIVYDLLWGKESFLIFYRKTESLLRQKKIAIPAIILVLGNWVWNIFKGL